MFGSHQSIFQISGFRRGRLLLVLCATMISVSVEAQEASNKTSDRRWYAGSASVDITPPADSKIWLSGYASRKEPATGVEQPIHAKALVMSQPGGEVVALVTLDLIGVRRPITRRVSDRIETRYGIPRKGLVLFTS
ncbi:MAG: hypothetical protein RJA81_289, partial [Planctomycetota bacterium]